MSKLTFILSACLVSGVVTGVVLLWPMLPHADVVFGPIENLQGIPFPAAANKIQIYEPLAHTDVQLDQWPIGKNLNLTISFVPHQLKKLAVGVRQDPFWLSYERVPLYDAFLDRHAVLDTAPKNNDVDSGLHRNDELPDNSKLYEKSVTIPLSDKIVSADGSLDLMFFAEDNTPISDAVINNPAESKIFWELNEISGNVSFQTPTITDLKSFVKVVITRERPL